MESYFKPGHLCRSGVAVIDDQTVLQPTVWLHLLSDILLSICHISVTTSQFSHGPLHFSTLQPQVYIETLPFFCSCQLGSDDKLLAVVVIYPLMRPLTQLSDISVFCQQARKLCAMKFFFFFLILWWFESLLNSDLERMQLRQQKTLGSRTSEASKKQVRRLPLCRNYWKKPLHARRAPRCRRLGDELRVVERCTPLACLPCASLRVLTRLWGMNKHICLAEEASQWALLGCRRRRGGSAAWED